MSTKPTLKFHNVDPAAKKTKLADIDSGDSGEEDKSHEGEPATVVNKTRFQDPMVSVAQMKANKMACASCKKVFLEGGGNRPRTCQNCCEFVKCPKCLDITTKPAKHFCGNVEPHSFADCPSANAAYAFPDFNCLFL